MIYIYDMWMVYSQCLAITPTASDIQSATSAKQACYDKSIPLTSKQARIQLRALLSNFKPFDAGRTCKGS